MKAKRNGRMTTHTVHVDLTDTTAWSTDETKGEIWPYRLIVNYQYSWVDGAWHVLSTVVYGWRSTARTGSGVKVTIARPENVPDWATGILTDNTPSPLAAPEMVRA